MTSVASHSPQEGASLRWIIALVLVQLAAGLAAAAYGWPFAAAPLVVLLVALVVAFPRLGFIVLMLSMFSKHSLPGTNGIYVSDVLSIPVVAGCLIRLFSTRGSLIDKNPLWAPMVAIVVYFGLSIVWANHPGPALVNWLRHVQLIALGLLISMTVEPEDIPSILVCMVTATVVISFYTIWQFAAVGGMQRVFGPAGWFFNTFLSMAMIHASVGAILSAKRWVRAGWIICAGICFLGLIATQTRSAMLQAIFGILFAVILAWYWARKHRVPSIRRRIVVLVAVTAAMILIFLFGQLVLFEAASARVEQAFEGRSNTIFIRLLLWKMGWQVFLDSPLLGSGLGQASRWSEQFNIFHLDPSSPRAGGLGVHNDAISYLAETGLIGTALIFWLLWVVMKMGWQLVSAAKSQRELYTTLLLYAPVGAIIAHYFYSAYLFYSIGGMVVAFYFGMLAKQHQPLRRAISV